MKTQKLAAIDIGSNSLKLVIVEAAASDSFTVALQIRERVRLGQDTLRTKYLSNEATDLSVGVINTFRSIAETRGVDAIIAVATAAVREAENAADFVREVKSRTGISVDVLSSIEEARLIGIAVSQHLGKEKSGSLLNIDIGGGSTELSLMKDGEPHKLFSLKLGAVGSSEKFLFSDPPAKQELKNLRKEIEFALERPLRKIGNEKWQVSTGTSGTILNLGALLNFVSLETPPESLLIELDKLKELNKSLAKMPLETRAQIGTISPQRAEVIVAGGQILEGVMRALNIKKLEPCSYALREGVIIDYLREVEAESLPPVPDVQDIKLRDIFAIGRRYGYEENHAIQVANLAEKIFDALSPIYDLKRHGRTLLSAAALLHDIGYHISHEAHHKHSLYLIKHSEITGFSEQEKLIIANIARYHRGSLPKDKHTDFIALSDTNSETVFRLGAILRLADALDRGYDSHVKDIEFERIDDQLLLRLISEKNCKAEYQAIEDKKDMFETAFGCSLIATRENAVSR
jgi:exopolyphosphatase / guanosine-5'-triphosphate,3'-diphosphate pyrophosphatase